MLLYTITLLIGTTVSGWLSDRLRRRKIFVAGSTLVFGVGLVPLAFADSVSMFYLAEIIMGLPFGIYAAVDTALVVDVLPDPDKPGKDLGVMNMANSLPQSPALALLGIGGAVIVPDPRRPLNPALRVVACHVTTRFWRALSTHEPPASSASR